MTREADISLEHTRPRHGNMLRNAVGILVGSAAIAACSGTGDVTYDPEATPLEYVTVCFSEKPDCTPEDVARGDGLDVISKGNSLPIETIPEVCGPNRRVENDTNADVPPILLKTLFDVEDGGFCEHDGVDWSAIGSAVADTLGGSPRGGSTITMQLVRIWYGSSLPENDVLRKTEEIRLAQQIETQYSKIDIAKAYLNGAYMGRGVYGFGAAAKVYFGIEPHQLDAGQSAALVALLQNPGKYEGGSGAEAEKAARLLHENERNEVLDLMAKYGTITPEEAANYKKTQLERHPYSYANNGADQVYGDFAVQMIMHDVIERLGSRDALFNLQSINTSISKKEQMTAFEHYKPRTLEQPNDGRQFGLVIVDETGAITAYLPGIYSDNPGALNINLLESPVVGGSQDKSFFVMAIMLAGDTPDTMVIDPERYEWLKYDGVRDYKPTEKADRCPGDGDCTLRDSIAYSANWGIVDRVKHYEDLGVPALQTGFDIMNSFGLFCFQPVGPAGIVGGCELTPTMRALGSMQINGLEGRAIPLDQQGRLINSIRLDSGKLLTYYDLDTSQYQQVVPIEIARDMKSIQRSVLEYGTLKRMTAKDKNKELFGKSGTPMNNTAPGANITWLADDGTYRSAAAVLRQPNSLSSLGRDADGGRATAILLNDIVLDLS